MKGHPIIGLVAVIVVVVVILAGAYLVYSIVWYLVHNHGFAPFLR